jgi:hypothetical protein
VVRVPNTALTFRPSRAAFAAVAQKPPVLASSPQAREQSREGRPAYVWKFENRRFVPIAVEAGVTDDFQTEIVNGPLQPGDTVLTGAAPF